MLKDYALHYYEQGYNCAESLVYGANVAWHLNLDENACHLMAGLGGGLQVGDVCGALTGAVCALGCLIVKTKAHDCAELKPLTQAVVEQVRQRLGSLRCEEIKPRLFQPEKRKSPKRARLWGNEPPSGPLAGRIAHPPLAGA